MRRILVTLAAALVVLTLAIAIPSWLRQRGNSNTSVTTNATASADINTATNSVPAANTAVTTLTDAQKVTNIALTFAERYGTTSSQNPNRNMLDASSLMTERYKRLILATLKPVTGALPTAYEGTTTRAVAVRIDNLTPGLRGTVIVTTSRQDFRAGRTDIPSYRQDISLTVQAENGTWYVDNAIWLNRISL